MRGNARQLLDEMRAGAAGDVRGAAAEDLHATDFQQLARGHLHAAEVRRLEARIETSAQRAADRLRLLRDLLAHVVRVAALVERLVGPGDGRRRLRRGAAVERRGLVSRRRAPPRSRRRRDARRSACGAPAPPGRRRRTSRDRRYRARPGCRCARRRSIRAAARRAPPGRRCRSRAAALRAPSLRACPPASRRSGARALRSPFRTGTTTPPACSFVRSCAAFSMMPL